MGRYGSTEPGAVPSMLVQCGVCDRYHDDTLAQPPYDRDGRIRYSSEEAGHEWVGTAHVALFSKEDEAEAIRQGSRSDRVSRSLRDTSGWLPAPPERRRCGFVVRDSPGRARLPS